MWDMADDGAEKSAQGGWSHMDQILRSNGSGPVYAFSRMRRRGTRNLCTYPPTRRMPVIVMTTKTTVGEEQPRLVPPLVYHDTSSGNRWLVEPPAGHQASEPAAFTGANARHAALEFAHRTYGCARYLAS